MLGNVVHGLLVAMGAGATGGAYVIYIRPLTAGGILRIGKYFGAVNTSSIYI